MAGSPHPTVDARSLPRRREWTSNRWWSGRAASQQDAERGAAAPRAERRGRDGDGAAQPRGQPEAAFERLEERLAQAQLRAEEAQGDAAGARGASNGRCRARRTTVAHQGGRGRRSFDD